RSGRRDSAASGLPHVHRFYHASMTRPCLATAAVLTALLFLLPRCTGETPPAPPTIPSSVDELPTMDAATFSQLIANQRGTPVLVNIWASWGTPCQKETPDLL